MGGTTVAYEPRDPARSVLHTVVRHHFETFRAQAASRREGDGLHVWVTLRHPWADGTTHLRFDPVELLGRLAVLVPRPRINLILYYGVLAPRAAWRATVVASAGSVWSDTPADAEPLGEDAPESPGPRRGYLWADLMRRTFGFDVLACPGCGGRLRLLALIEHPPVVERMLRHLGLPTERPEPRPARAPPQSAFEIDNYSRTAADDTF